jgi:hypothetical protein
MVSALEWSEARLDRSEDEMDALAAFDNAVEKLLEDSPIEILPEQLVKLRFLFEEEFDKLWLEDAMSVE